jgi:DNA-binding response OmpR family regulator
VILMTGHTVTDDDVIPLGATILRKPFDIDELVRVLQSRE